MKALKSVFAIALVMLGTSALAAPQVHSVVVGGDSAVDKGLFAYWSSVCVANVDLKADVATQVRYGGDAGQWQDYTIPQNTIYVFSQKVPNGYEPMLVSLQFASVANGPMLSYDLAQTSTGLRVLDCGRLENYKFAATDAGNGGIDLVHVP